ncbi:hypothetical protein B1987_28860, partial [Mycobacterium kansasii]
MAETVRAFPSEAAEPDTKIGSHPYIEKCADRRQDGAHDQRRQPPHPVSTLPPSYPVDPPAENPGYAPVGYPPLGAGYPAPVEPASGYGAMPPGYGAPPGYGPPPGYSTPGPGYGLPGPGYGLPGY